MKVHTPSQTAGACAVVLTALLVGACSSSGSKAGSSPPASSALPASTAVAPATSASGGASAPSAGPAADAATTAAVKHAYETFFDYRTPTSTGMKLLQDGPAFASALQAAAASAASQKITVRVTNVSTVSANVAKVIYTLNLAGKPTLQGASGFAVRENGSWKVAGVTFCGLLNLNGVNPPVCKNPAATKLPM